MGLNCLLRFTVTVIAISATLAQRPNPGGPPLSGSFLIKKDRITLSGISTGGTFAQNVHLSHSRLFSGIGTFSSFFWKCGDQSASLEAFYATCGKPGGYDVQGNLPKPGADDPALAIKTARSYAITNQIDNLENLARQKIFMWQGTIDEFVTPNIGLSSINIYEPYLYSPEQIHTKIQYGRHHFPTFDKGTLCPIQSDPTVDAYIGNCQYYGAYNMLNWLIGSRTAPLQLDSGLPLMNNLMLFDQTEFMDTPNIGLANEGFIYVPTNCNPTKRKVPVLKPPACYLHFYFHGCFLTRGEVGTNHIKGSGLLQVAEKNNIIIVFPMALVTSFNSGGCFDSFGYTGVNYATKSGPQVKAVYKMLRRLLNNQRIDNEDFHEANTSMPIPWVASTTNQPARYPWPTYSWSLNYTRH